MGKIIPMHRSTARVRKKDTGEKGNRGEFASTTRSEADVAVLNPHHDGRGGMDTERQARLLSEVQQRSGVDPTMVMSVDQAATALRIAEDEGSAWRAPISSHSTKWAIATTTTARSPPQRAATSELFSDMIRGHCSLTPGQRRELVDEAATLAAVNDQIQQRLTTWDPGTTHPGQMARLRLMQVMVGVQHSDGPDGTQALVDEFMREKEPARRARLGEMILHESEMAQTLSKTEGTRDLSGGGETDNGGPMYAGYYGSNYERTDGLYGAELTKEIRSDLKRARTEGYIPPGYRLRVNKAGSSSSHQSINVLISPPEGHRPHFRGQQMVFGELEDVPIEKPADSIVRTRIEQIVGSYNRDTSNSQVDYFNRRFYERVDWVDGARLEVAE